MVKRSREWRGTMYYNLFVPVVVIFVALDGLYQPLVLNTKSLRPMAEYMAKTFRGEKLYQYVNDPMMHFFGADYYLGDELAQFETPVRSVVEGKTVVEKKTPTTGGLVVPEGDFEKSANKYSFPPLIMQIIDKSMTTQWRNLQSRLSAMRHRRRETALLSVELQLRHSGYQELDERHIVVCHHSRLP